MTLEHPVLTSTQTAVISRTGPKRILVVEDSPELAQAVGDMLKAFGHEVEVCEDGRHALAAFKPGRFDLVITDYSMPRMNGVELAEIIKKRAAGQKILMITAFAFTIAAYDGRPLPVDALLRKPFHPRELQEVVAGFFAVKSHDTRRIQRAAKSAHA